VGLSKPSSVVEAISEKILCSK